jgi:hypothetical protein
VLRRLLGRAGGADDDRLAALERQVRKLQETERERGTSLDARLATLAERVGQQPNAKDLRELRQAVRALAAADDRQVLDELARIAASGRPIVVGPWTGELGFELLYWIPFVEWVRRHWAIASSRLLVVSRGGVAAWYRVPESQYADIFSFMPPEDFRQAVAEDKRKQRHVSALDRRILDAVGARRGPGDVELLHPRFMFHLFAPFWRDEAGYARLEQFMRPRLLDASTALGPPGLPPEYAAVRFYFSESFPDTPDNRAFAARVLESVAARMPVVMLNPGFRVDDHDDWSPATRTRVQVISGGMDPVTNLAVQGAIIAGARVLVGTFGGYPLLAPLLRVPAVAFYARPLFKWHHVYAAQRVFADAGAAPLTLIDAAQAAVVETSIAHATSGAA